MDQQDFDNLLAGGGDWQQQQTFPQQQMQVPQIIVVEDGGPWIITGVVVPLVIALVGWWLQRRWKNENPGMKLTWENVKKSREKSPQRN